VARQQVFREQNFTRTALETAQVNAVSFKAHPAGGEAANLADRDEKVTALDTDNGSDDWGVGVIAHPGHEVANAADAVTVYVVERAP
jgi:hypothetical protein